MIHSDGYFAPTIRSGENDSQHSESLAGRLGQVKEDYEGEHDDPKFHELVKKHGGSSTGKKYKLPTSNLEKFHETARKSGFKYSIRSGKRLFSSQHSEDEQFAESPYHSVLTQHGYVPRKAMGTKNTIYEHKSKTHDIYTDKEGWAHRHYTGPSKFEIKHEGKDHNDLATHLKSLKG